MNLFDQLVTQAIQHKPDLASLRVVVEKELLHHDILRILHDEGLLQNLSFIGGTCLRACYGSHRLSEDLDFTGGHHFSRNSLSSMGKILVAKLQHKYGLHVSVDEPIKDKKNVDTWKLKIQTRPDSKHLPAQRIHIDICLVPSYEIHPMMLINPYGVEMGTSNLVLSAQSREEIYADKLIAFAFRPNRIKYRDLWDILWLHGKGIKPAFKLIPLKLQDRKLEKTAFFEAFDERTSEMQANKAEMINAFTTEMLRFLPQKESIRMKDTNVWDFILYLLKEARSHDL